MFRNGGYHISNSFSCCAGNEDISQAAAIAVKRAELKKLTRKECKAADVDKNFLSFLLVGMLTDFRRFMDARYDDFCVSV